MRGHAADRHLKNVLGYEHDVAFSCTAEDAKLLADDIEFVMRMAPAHSPGASARQRLSTLATALRAAAIAPAGLAAYQAAADGMKAVEEKTEFDVNLPTTGTAKVVSPKLVTPTPPEHQEWAIKVYKADASGNPNADESLARTFGKDEKKARDFFSRTQNVHNAKVRNREAISYLILIGVQDDRKHKKAGSFQELERALCKG